MSLINFLLALSCIAFEKVLILLYVERKSKKKDRDRVSLRRVVTFAVMLQFYSRMY